MESFNRVVSQGLCFCLILELGISARWNPAFGTDFSEELTLPKDLVGKGSGNEYASGGSPGTVFMKVNLWGAVGKPGIHYIPYHTDFLTLMSYSGGPTESAKMDKVLIKRRFQQKEESIEINLEKLIGKPEGEKNILLEPNDIIIVPASKPLINGNVASTIAFVSSVLSLVLVSFVLSDRFKSNNR